MVKKSKKDDLQISGSLFEEFVKIGKDFDITPQDYNDDEKFSRHISTGIANLDNDLNYGKGLPLGVMCEFYGKESGGKSYLAQRICGNAQKQYPELAVVYVDLENSVVPERIKEIGVNINNDRYIEIPQMGNAEKCFNYLIKVLKEHGDKVSIVVVDSLKAITQPEWAEDNQKTHLAQFLSKYIPEIHSICTQKQITTVLINQVRINLQSAMRGYMEEVTPGGDTVNFFAHLRLRVKRVPGKDGAITIGDKVVGHMMEIYTKKTKLGIPQQTYYSPLYYLHVSLGDRLFILGRNNRYADEGNKKIISVMKDVFTFKNLKVEGEKEFKNSLFKDNLLIDLYDELSCVCDVEGIPRSEVEEHYKNGPEETILENAKTLEEYEEQEKMEDNLEQINLNRQINYASKTAIDSENVSTS